jgi:hypothetical protein
VTEVQMFTIALSTVPTMVVVLVDILSSNVRLGDVRDLLRAEMDKNHSEMLHRFAELDARLTRIENGLGMRGST